MKIQLDDVWRIHHTMWPVRASKFKINSSRYYYHLGSCCCCEVRDEASQRGESEKRQVEFQRLDQHSTPFTRESGFQVLRAHVQGLEWGCRHKILLTGLQNRRLRTLSQHCAALSAGVQTVSPSPSLKFNLNHDRELFITSPVTQQ